MHQQATDNISLKLIGSNYQYLRQDLPQCGV